MVRVFRDEKFDEDQRIKNLKTLASLLRRNLIADVAELLYRLSSFNHYAAIHPIYMGRILGHMKEFDGSSDYGERQAESIVKLLTRIESLHSILGRIPKENVASEFISDSLYSTVRGLYDLVKNLRSLFGIDELESLFSKSKEPILEKFESRGFVFLPEISHETKQFNDSYQRVITLKYRGQTFNVFENVEYLERIPNEVLCEIRSSLRKLLDDMSLEPVVAAGSHHGDDDVFLPTPLQTAIIETLNGRAMKKEELAAKIGVDGTRLYREGGIKELSELGIVKLRQGRGYYRPDAPPPDAIVHMKNPPAVVKTKVAPKKSPKHPQRKK